MPISACTSHSGHTHTCTHILTHAHTRTHTRTHTHTHTHTNMCSQTHSPVSQWNTLGLAMPWGSGEKTTWRGRDRTFTIRSGLCYSWSAPYEHVLIKSHMINLISTWQIQAINHKLKHYCSMFCYAYMRASIPKKNFFTFHCVKKKQSILLLGASLGGESVCEHNTATRCNMLQHTATHCNTLQLATTRYNTTQHTATYCMMMISFILTLGEIM